MVMSSRSVQGRTVMVTGGGSGLGRAICTEMAEAGGHVIVADVDPHGAAATAAAISEKGGSAEVVEVDITRSDQVDAAVNAAFEAHGRSFDCLVNNAGTDRGDDLVEIDDERWRQVFAVNVDGPMYASRAFVRGRNLLEHEGPPADLVFVSSISALTVGAGAAAYNASKAALTKFAEIVQTEARERSWPVRVTAMHPAAMNTPMMEQWGLQPEQMMDPAIVAGLIRTAISLPPEVVLQTAVPTLRRENYPR